MTKQIDDIERQLIGKTREELLAICLPYLRKAAAAGPLPPTAHIVRMPMQDFRRFVAKMINEAERRQN